MTPIIDPIAAMIVPAIPSGDRKIFNALTNLSFQVNPPNNILPPNKKGQGNPCPM